MNWANSIKAILWLMLIGIALFASAGTLDWPGAWIFLAEYLFFAAWITLWLARYDPALLKERMGNVYQKGQSAKDKMFMSFIVVVWYGWLVMMGLDVERWQFSHMPAALTALGAILIPIGFYIVWLTFRANTFAAPVIRIQSERSQRVIDTGPYAVIRHPMYAGAGLYMAGMPLVLGSWLGLIVLPFIFAALILRIFIEEDALTKGLSGYDAYTERVRYRIIPSLW